MQVKNIQEIKDYSESIYFGLSLRQFFFSVIACVVAIIIYFIFINKLGMEMTTWLCIIGALPFAALGFIKYQSMNAEEIFISYWRSFILKRTDLINQPYNLYLETAKSLIEKERKEALIKDDKKLRKMETNQQRKGENS